MKYGCVFSLAFAATVLSISQAHGADVAYAWAHNPTATSYSPASLYVYNAGAPVTVSRLSTGQYRVDFGRVASVGANVQVSMYGYDPGHCGVQSWGSFRVFVNCFDGYGNPADRRFSVLAIAAEPSDAGDLMYAWLEQPMLTGPYQPYAPYRFDDGSLRVGPYGGRPGWYSPYWAIAPRNVVMLTPYATTAKCYILLQASNRTLFECVDSRGVTVMTRASLLIARSGFAGLSAVLKPHPGTGFGGWSSNGSAQRVNHVATGVYHVDVGPEADIRGHVQAIGYMADATCHVGSFHAGRVTVLCYQGRTPADSGFQVIAIRR